MDPTPGRSDPYTGNIRHRLDSAVGETDTSDGARRLLIDNQSTLQSASSALQPN